jgi:hypothetical protein
VIQVVFFLVIVADDFPAGIIFRVWRRHLSWFRFWFESPAELILPKVGKEIVKASRWELMAEAGASDSDIR